MSGKRTRKRLSGWPIVGWAALFACGGSALLISLLGTGEQAMGAVLRFTARTSFAFYLAAFAAAPLAALDPAPLFRWLRANRRYLGVSFAVSHAVHLVAIVRLGLLHPGLYDPVTLILGGLGFVFLAAMAATSFNATTRRLGPRAWKALHKTGMYYLGFVFIATFAGRIAERPLYVFFPLVFFAAWALRVFVFIRLRARNRADEAAPA
jgi:methionine sulfoxide reductase heme-binding subunit